MIRVKIDTKSLPYISNKKAGISAQADELIREIEQERKIEEYRQLQRLMPKLEEGFKAGYVRPEEIEPIRFGLIRMEEELGIKTAPKPAGETRSETAIPLWQTYKTRQVKREHGPAVTIYEVPMPDGTFVDIAGRIYALTLSGILQSCKSIDDLADYVYGGHELKDRRNTAINLLRVRGQMQNSDWEINTTKTAGSKSVYELRTRFKTPFDY